MSEWIHLELTSIGSPAIVEYIGPYGAGKTTKLSRDKRELHDYQSRVLDGEDFKGFIAGHTKAQKAFLLFFNLPLYLLTFVLLFGQSRGAIIADRVRRCHLVAIKSIYFRRFMGGHKKIFLSDEGILHSCCQLFTGAPRVPSAWLLKLLYWRLRPIFIRFDMDEIRNVELLSRREQPRAIAGCAIGGSPQRKTFVDLMKSGDLSNIRFLVRESRRFYREVTPVVSQIWGTLHTFPLEESNR